MIATSVPLGISYSLGVLVDPLARGLGAGHGAVALAFSLTVALPFLLAPLTGRLSDRYGPRPLLIAAAIISTGGLLVSSTATTLWTLYVTLGLGVGGAAALAFVPMIAAVGGWFERRRALALAIALAGTGAGTLVGSPLIGALVHAHGFRMTCAVLAAVTAVSLPLAAAMASAPPTGLPRPVRWTDDGRGFARLYLAGIAGSLAAFIPFALLVPFAIERGIREVDAAWLIGVAGAANLAGRLLVPALSRWRGLLGSYRLTFLALALSGALWLSIGRSLPSLVAVACVFGSAYGAFVALSPAVAADLLGTNSLGRRLGALYTSGGIGALVGPVVAGAAVDSSGDYRVATALVVAAGLVGALILSIRRLSVGGVLKTIVRLGSI